VKEKKKVVPRGNTRVTFDCEGHERCEEKAENMDSLMPGKRCGGEAEGGIVGSYKRHREKRYRQNGEGVIKKLGGGGGLPEGWRRGKVLRRRSPPRYICGILCIT